MPQTPGVYIEEIGSPPPAVIPAPTSVTAFVGLTHTGPTHEPVEVGGWAGFLRTFGERPAPDLMALAVQLYFANGGRRALIVRLPPGARAETAWVPTSAAARQARRGIYALDAVDGFNLLCLPPPAMARDFTVTAWSRAAAYCRLRRAVLLVDAPQSWTDQRTAEQGMAALLDGVGPQAASHVAVYQPRLRLADPGGTGPGPVGAPCGAAAGVIARIDAQRGVWKAPAGTEAVITGAPGLVSGMSSAERDALNRIGLNSLYSSPQRGTVVWGARTLLGNGTSASEWTYLPVRRLALHVERSILNSTGWVVFEPNDEPLWQRLRTVVTDFLYAIWRQGGLAGHKPEEAFFVQCDRSTVTAADIAAGQVPLRIGIAALKPAEFVILSLKLNAGT